VLSKLEGMVFVIFCALAFLATPRNSETVFKRILPALVLIFTCFLWVMWLFWIQMMGYGEKLPHMTDPISGYKIILSLQLDFRHFKRFKTARLNESHEGIGYKSHKRPWYFFHVLVFSEHGKKI
jgi:hypothetical protein